MEHLWVLQSCTSLEKNYKIWSWPLKNVQYTNILTHVGYSNYDFLSTTSSQSAWCIVNTQQVLWIHKLTNGVTKRAGYIMWMFHKERKRRWLCDWNQEILYGEDETQSICGKNAFLVEITSNVGRWQSVSMNIYVSQWSFT